jgi:hypothetical protein
MKESALEKAAASWRASSAPADFIHAAQQIPMGTERVRVLELLGEPSQISPLADGGESWLYVPNDPAHGQFEALFVTLTPDDRFARLDRKPIE